MEERLGQKRPRPPSSTEDKQPRPQKKKQLEKLRDARRIAVQSQSPALASGSIDVNAFTAARSFEISALQKAMRSSKAALAQRAFQDVPRSLRRRSASHNVKRVPKHLREKAAREMLADGTKAAKPIRGRKRLRTEKRRLQGKNGQPDKGGEETVIDDAKVEEGSIPKLKPRKVTKGKFANRQEDKTWLPTHLYHAKRARVDPRWGFSIPITPTEKSFRPTYRASHHAGLIAFDTSYFATLFLDGTETAIRKVLDMVIEPGSPASAKRYSLGKRSCETVLYHRDAFPAGMIGPALVLWRAQVEGTVQVMVRLHPAVAQEVWEEFHECAGIVGEGLKIEDARFEIGAIDLFGPLATEALFTILKPGKGASSTIWNRLRGLSDPTSLPLGSLLDLDLCDPRIDFPPRKIKVAPSPQLTTLLQQWPPSIPGPITLFNPSNRTAAKKYIEIHTRGTLQKARHDLLLKGQPPVLRSSDAIIPSLLLRRDNGAWTLLLPWSWVAEFWYSFLHYPQARFGGITEYAQICFEKHGMAFPEDWPGTRAGDEEEWRVARRCREQWERRPNGKRESWGRVIKGGEIGDPFSCDWKLIFKKETRESNDEPAKNREEDTEVGETDVIGIEVIRAQAKAAMETEQSKDFAPSATTNDIPYFLLSPDYGKQLLTRTSPLQTTIDLSRALLPIRLHFLQKGNIVHRARIYRLPILPEHRQQWVNLVKTRAKVSRGQYPVCPGVEDLLGFVTTGNVSLLEGRGRAVGALGWERAKAEDARWDSENEFRRWCIVRDVGKDVGRVARWEVND